MAVSTINPWAGGAVVINQQPYMAFYERQMARQQAKEDALSNYFKDLGKNITSAGMRSQDVPTLLKKQQEWQQLGIQKKNELLNPRLDNGQSLIEYQNRYNEMQGLINESKEALKTMDQVGKMRLNPQTSYIGDDPDFINQIQKHELPIGDPNREGINLATISIPPKPIGTKEKEEFNKYITGGINQDKIPGDAINIGGFKTQTPIVHSYSDESKNIFGQRAGQAYDTDKSWRVYANSIYKDTINDPIKHQQLNNIYQKYYNKDIDDPRSAFIAQTIKDHDVSSVEYKEGEDSFGRDKAMEAIRFGHQKELKKTDQDAADSWIVDFWDNRIRDAKSNQPTPIPEPDNPLTIKMAYEVKPDAVMMKGLARNGIEPDRVYVTPDNKIMPVFYKYKDDYDEKGKKVGTSVKVDNSGNPEIDKDISKEMDLDQAYLSLGYRGQTKKQLGGTMQGTYNVNKKENKPKKVVQGGHTYILNEKTGEYE